MGWIEAKKHCESLSRTLKVGLLAIESEEERDNHLERIQRSARSRHEYWTAGNDIDDENVWIWSGRRGLNVPEFGWLDRPLASNEENCLTWSVTISRRSPRMSEGWHADSCCNNIRFICEA